MSVSAKHRSIARLLWVLALIVQIIAPVHAAVAMATVVTDPLAGMVICSGNGATADRTHPDSAPDHRVEACFMCRLVNGDGFALPPTLPAMAVLVATMRGEAWATGEAPAIRSRLLEQIRGRAPPSFS